MYEIEGRAMRILKLAFDITHADYVADWTSAREIVFSVGNKRIMYKAIDDEKRIDQNGLFIPRKCQNLIIDMIPEEES